MSRRWYLALAAVLLVGCGGSTEAANSKSLTDETAPTRPATASTTFTTSVKTTVSTTMPAAGLPVPHEPPDPHGFEPVVELGSIEIPRMGLNKPFFEGITLGTLALGPGHWPGTALPGAIGNVVVGGHRTADTRPFRYLDKLLPGDEVVFVTTAGRFVYRVVRTDIVTPDAIWIIDQTTAYTATLFACHPVGSTKERIVVFLELSVQQTN